MHTKILWALQLSFKTGNHKCVMTHDISYINKLHYSTDFFGNKFWSRLSGYMEMIVRWKHSISDNWNLISDRSCYNLTISYISCTLNHSDWSSSVEIYISLKITFELKFLNHWNKISKRIISSLIIKTYTRVNKNIQTGEIKCVIKAGSRHFGAWSKLMKLRP